MKRPWLLGSLCGLLYCGCASQVPNERLARVPMADKDSVIAAQRNVDVAEQNVASARAARDEAKQYRGIAGRELDSAKASLDAARRGVSLSQTSRQGQGRVTTAQRTVRVEERGVIAARSKRDYADQLVNLRDAQLDEQKGSLDVAKSDLELRKLHIVQRNNLAGGLNEGKFVSQLHKAQSNLADRRMRVSAMESQTNNMRTAWEQRRREFNVASREAGISPLSAPPPAETMPLPNRLNNVPDTTPHEMAPPK